MNWLRTAVSLAATCMLLALPAAALAAPIPGAHYSGTTDQNYPISFDVAPDGQSLTNVVTTYNASCTFPGPATAQQYSVNSAFAFPVAGDAFSGDDPDRPPYLKLQGTFTTPTEASGTFSGFSGGFSGGSPYFCNALNRAWSATTTATAGGGDGGTPGGGDPGGGYPGGGDPGGGDPGGGGPAAPVVTIAVPTGLKLKASLKNGLVLAVGVDQLSALAATLYLRPKEAKKYGYGSKFTAISKAKAKNAGPDTLLEFTFKKAIRKRLKNAKKLTLWLDVSAVRKSDGWTGTGSATIKLG